jgi:hypothetical protein
MGRDSSPVGSDITTASPANLGIGGLSMNSGRHLATPAGTDNTTGAQGPVPGHAYTIRLKGSDATIALGKNGLCLGDVRNGANADTTWLCVDGGVFLGFYNQSKGMFLGHDGEGGICATHSHLRDWERFVPQAHETGGFQLLSPERIESEDDQIEGWKVVVEEDGMELARAKYGLTLWCFEEVPGP